MSGYARTNIEAQAWTDTRFDRLARALGLADRDTALIRCARLWAWQTDNYHPDRPTYVVDAETIEIAMGIDGAAQALVKVGLAEETPSGFRIRGSKDRVEWLWSSRTARKRSGHNQTLSADPSPDRSPDPSADRSRDPSSSLFSPSSDQTLPPSRAIPQGESAWHRHARWWAYMRDQHRKLRDEGVDWNAPDFAPSFGGHESNMRRCDQHLTSGGYLPEQLEAKGIHVVDVFAADSRRERHLRWFKPSLIWDPEKFARAADTTLEEASRPRGPPTKAKPTDHVGRVAPSNLNDYPETGKIKL